MEMLEDWLKCKCCTETLVKPVLLPCGNSICKYHEEECINSGSKSIYCASCELSHDIPETLGFPRVLALEKLLEQKAENNSNPTDLDDDYKEAMDKYKEFSDLFDEFEKLINDPEMTIHNEFNELRNKVDLRREELKCRIDEDALKIIAQINEYETECKANLPSIKSEEKKTDIESKKVKMGLWKTQLDKPQNDIQFWENINNEIGEHLDTFKSELEDFEDRVFLNRYYDYSDLYMSIGNDYDMIKDHSLKFVVKNLSQYKDKPLDITGDSIRALGIDWSVNVSISKDEDQVQYVYMYLSYNPVEKKSENVKIICDLVVVNRIDPSKSIRNECHYDENDENNNGSNYDDEDDDDDYDEEADDEEDNNDDNTYEDDDYDEEDSFDHNNNYKNKEVNKIIKFDDLINDNELYDKETDSFIAQIDIKSIKWSNA